MPSGDYSLTAIIVAGSPSNPDDLALYGNPALTVSTEFNGHAQIVDTIAGRDISSTISGRPGLPLRTWPSPSTSRPYHFVYVDSQTEPLTTLPSPRVYNLAFPTAGRIPATLTFTAAPESLALVNTVYASRGVPSGDVGPHSVVIDFDGIGGAFDSAGRAPDGTVLPLDVTVERAAE